MGDDIGALAAAYALAHGSNKLQSTALEKERRCLHLFLQLRHSDTQTFKRNQTLGQTLRNPDTQAQPDTQTPRQPGRNSGSSHPLCKQQCFRNDLSKSCAVQGGQELCMTLCFGHSQFAQAANGIGLRKELRMIFAESVVFEWPRRWIPVFAPHDCGCCFKVQGSGTRVFVSRLVVAPPGVPFQGQKQWFFFRVQGRSAGCSIARLSTYVLVKKWWVRRLRLSVCACVLGCLAATHPLLGV